jgi:hypothetical protein
MAPVDDFSFLDDTPPIDRVAEFKKLKAGCLIKGSLLDGDIAIIPAKNFAGMFPSATCYLPEEIEYLFSLEDDRAGLVHRIKRAGGFLEIKQGENKTKCSETVKEGSLDQDSPFALSMLD